MKLLRHHEFVALGIDAHGKMERIVFGVIGLRGEAATAFGEAGDTFAQIIELKRQSRPSPLTLAAAMHADGGTGDDDFTPDFRLE